MLLCETQITTRITLEIIDKIIVVYFFLYGLKVFNFRNFELTRVSTSIKQIARLFKVLL